MKRALVAVSFEVLHDALQLPADVVIDRVTLNERRPDDIVMLLRGEGLPDACRLEPEAMVPYIRAFLTRGENGISYEFQM